MIRATRALAGTAAGMGALAMIAVALGGCSDDGNKGAGCAPGDSFCIEELPRIELQPADDVVTITDVGMEPGDEVVREIRVINTGFGALQLREVTLAYTTPVGATDDRGVPFSLVSLPDLPTGIQVFGSDRFPQGVGVQVRYTKQSDSVPRTAVLTFRSNDPLKPTHEISVTTDVGIPRLATSPSTIDFGLVARSDERAVRTLTLLNTGSRTLAVSGFRIGRDGRFGVRGPGFDISGPDGFLGVDLVQPVLVPAGETSTVEVTFLSDSPAPAEGDLIIYSDDPTSGAEGHIVRLIANRSGPCIQVQPRRIDFGGKIVGQRSTINLSITSCGTEPLEVRSVRMAPGSSADFGFDFTTLPAGFESGVGTTNPLVIPINESVTLGVTFVPDSVNPRDADNVPIPDIGTALIGSNAFESEVAVELEGAGSDVDCPTPIIHVQEGEEVVPLTVLHLDATQSFAPFGRIQSYFWSVQQPPGSSSVMIPSFTDPRPVLEANVSGTYTFRLDVADEFGNRSGGASECETAVYQVLVQPDQAIHVELTWFAEGAPDPLGGEGSGVDLDLHFAHQNASGPDLTGDGLPDPWFDTTWDVFWYNPTPIWGSFDPNVDDNPSLDRDDTHGGGPENISLVIPESDVTYTIGVHYWNDWSHGVADATVRVRHFGELVYEQTLLDMVRLDMWCVGRIHWPIPEVEPCAPEGEPELVTPNYVNTFFQPPVF